MDITRRLIRYARLDPSEEKNFRLLFLQTLLFGFGASFYLVVVSAYFIKKTSIASFPAGYIISGLFGFLLTAFYKKTLGRGGAVRAYSFVLLSFGLLSVLLFVLRQAIPDASPYSKYVAYLGFIGISPYLAIIALGFSTITLRVFNIAQSKRLLALIGTGEVAAAFIAFLSVPFLTKIVGGPVPLLLFSAAASFLAIVCLRPVAIHNKAALAHVPGNMAVKKPDLQLFFKNQFYLLFAVVTIFSVLAVYFVDFSFLLSVRYVATDSGIETAKVVSVVYCIIRLGEIIFSLLSRRIMSAQGMKFALILQPLVLSGSVIIASVSGVVFWDIPLFVVAFLLFNKWAIRVIGRSLTTPAMKVLYMVAEPQDRAQLQTNIDGTLNQYTAVVSGILLWVISNCSGHMDVVPFLKLLTIICIVAFVLWASFTNKLFANYKLKIKEYLHHLLKHGQDKQAGRLETDRRSETLRPVISTHHPVLEKALADGFVFNPYTINEYISCYNPAIKNFNPGDPLSFSILKRAYYNNENFFSRLLIIWHTGSIPYKARLSFVKEFYGISELQLRTEMMKMLNEEGIKPEQADSYFFTSLAEECVKGIMWTEATLSDVAEQVSQPLIDELRDHVNIQKALLFELLKTMYETESIKAIQDVVNSKDRSFENKIFAVELLDNILAPALKKLIIPVFEDISFQARKEKLQKIILVYNLSCPERLKEILMANFMTVGPYIKQLALEEYYRLTGDKSVPEACLWSNLENLGATAGQLLNTGGGQLFAHKIKAIEALELNSVLPGTLIAYYAKWGLLAKQKNGLANKNVIKQAFQHNAQYTEPVGNGVMSADTLGLWLMLRVGGVQVTSP